MQLSDLVRLGKKVCRMQDKQAMKNAIPGGNARPAKQCFHKLQRESLENIPQTRNNK